MLDKVRVKGKTRPLVIYEIMAGDSEAIFLSKEKTLANYQAGLESYFQRDFSQAGQRFKDVLSVCPEDKAAALFAERTALFDQQGVPDNWDGVADMERK